MAIKQTTMNKTAKEWIASVKDPVIKRYLEENVEKYPLFTDRTFERFWHFMTESFDWNDSPQGFDFYLDIAIADPSTVSYSDFKHLDKSVEQTKVSVNEDAVEFKKEHILDAYRKGFSEGVCFGASPTGYNHISAEEYFNKKFKK